MSEDANIVNLSDHRPVTVHLLSYDGIDKVLVIKVVKDEFDLGLADAKKLVESTPCEIGTYPSKAGAKRLQSKFEGAGATVDLR